jgi:hypothetical protein
VGEKVDRESFWGIKHAIEQIPILEARWRSGADLESDFILGFYAPFDSTGKLNYIEAVTCRNNRRCCVVLWFVFLLQMRCLLSV